jgi:DNA-binding transcriptional regulator YiaG
MDDFSEQLHTLKKKLDFTQIEMCAALYDVPHRTLQSWLQNEKLPPNYVKNLIIKHLESLLAKKK